MWPDEYLESGYNMQIYAYYNTYNMSDKSRVGMIYYTLYGDIDCYISNDIYTAIKELEINYYDCEK